MKGTFTLSTWLELSEISKQELLLSGEKAMMSQRFHATNNMPVYTENVSS